MNKEIIDALHMLLHCSLKDTEYETQKKQFKAILDYICSLEKENQELKEQIEVGKEQYNDLVEEKENLQEQLDYLRGGEYLNQLRFERDMLQHVVDTNGVPSEVYDYLECTHRNTELLEENQELKKLVIVMDEVANKYKEVIDKMNKYMYSGYLINSKEIKDILKEVE